MPATLFTLQCVNRLINCYSRPGASRSDEKILSGAVMRVVGPMYNYKEIQLYYEIVYLIMLFLSILSTCTFKDRLGNFVIKMQVYCMITEQISMASGTVVFNVAILCVI